MKNATSFKPLPPIVQMYAIQQVVKKWNLDEDESASYTDGCLDDIRGILGYTDVMDRRERIAETVKCAEDIVYFAENYIHLDTIDGKKIPLELHSYHKRNLRALVDNRFYIINSARQMGLTTMLQIFALWKTLFSSEQCVGIVSHSHDNRIALRDGIRKMYESIEGLGIPTLVSNEQSLEFENKSSIRIFNQTQSGIRGIAVSTLLIDNAAFFDQKVFREMWEYTLPVITSNKKSQFVLGSATNQAPNIFQDILDDAEDGTNGWKYDVITFREKPGLDTKWTTDMLMQLGLRGFMSEYNCQIVT